MSVRTALRVLAFATALPLAHRLGAIAAGVLHQSNMKGGRK